VSKDGDWEDGKCDGCGLYPVHMVSEHPVSIRGIGGDDGPTSHTVGKCQAREFQTIFCYSSAIARFVVRYGMK
jgi:hypothetical protein